MELLFVLHGQQKACVLHGSYFLCVREDVGIQTRGNDLIYREKRPRPRPARVRSASVSSNSIVRPASGPRPLPFFPGEPCQPPTPTPAGLASVHQTSGIHVRPGQREETKEEHQSIDYSAESPKLMLTEANSTPPHTLVAGAGQRAFS
eukprot:gene8169-biopygen10626